MKIGPVPTNFAASTYVRSSKFLYGGRHSLFAAAIPGSLRDREFIAKRLLLQRNSARGWSKTGT